MYLLALQIALEIAARAVESEGYKPHIISDSVIGEARLVTNHCFFVTSFYHQCYLRTYEIRTFCSGVFLHLYKFKLVLFIAIAVKRLNFTLVILLIFY